MNADFDLGILLTKSLLTKLAIRNLSKEVSYFQYLLDESSILSYDPMMF